MINRFNISEIEKRMGELNLPLHEFHLVGIRSQESISDRFDDSMYVIWKNKIIGGPYWCTTNPGQYYLQNLLNPKGTAILVADKQYHNCFKLGLHKGKDALIQCDNLLVYRDKDLDNLAEEAGEIIDAPESCRIDIHGANTSITSIIVGKWSAGCQVIADPDDFRELLSLCRSTAKGLFTYSLLKEW